MTKGSRFNMCCISSVISYEQKLKIKLSTHFIVRTYIDGVHGILHLLITLNRVLRKLYLFCQIQAEIFELFMGPLCFNPNT